MWFLNCMNPQPIQRLYDSVEGLDLVEIHEIVLHRDGPWLQLRMELPRFPDHPPTRWQREADTVQVTLDLWSVEDVKLEGWGTDNVGRFTLDRSSDGLHALFVADAARLSARCDLARIARMSEYTAGPREAGDHLPTDRAGQE